VTEIPDAVIELAATHPKLCAFFHIPLQSGMMRSSSVWADGITGQYRDRIREIRHQIPDVALSADVNRGVAGEGEEQFQNTVGLLEERV